jgi:hypothetical protein
VGRACTTGIVGGSGSLLYPGARKTLELQCATTDAAVTAIVVLNAACSDADGLTGLSSLPVPVIWHQSAAINVGSAPMDPPEQVSWVVEVGPQNVDPSAGPHVAQICTSVDGGASFSATGIVWQYTEPHNLVAGAGTGGHDYLLAGVD